MDVEASGARTINKDRKSAATVHCAVHIAVAFGGRL
jgi:hypothetical protein